MAEKVEYRVTLSSLAFASRQYVVAGESEGWVGEIDKDDVARAIRIAKNLAELDYLAIIVAPSVVKVERRTNRKAEWRELVSAYRIQPGTPVMVWGGGSLGSGGPSFHQVVFGSWKPELGGCGFFTREGRRMGLYVKDDVFEVLPANAAV